MYTSNIDLQIIIQVDIMVTRYETYQDTIFKK